ncbi:winged helix-turn-helix transcriptional regulator [Novosphingobium lentum]|uniref:winged helix-turn-helix transcriptional regulator n=1 Tax=Novosphingobium lentum TaxID=145287 RepID=UPI000834D965|nr:helix-turn-helix domain-containing protein [Novosphingobium lentum]
MKHFRSGCPIASALDLVGDKWTLVILRSMMMGATSYSDLARQPERIATNILSDRLSRMEACDLIVADRVRQGSIRGAYRLTPKGADLLPVVQELARWGEKHLADRWQPPERFYAIVASDLATDRS